MSKYICLSALLCMAIGEAFSQKATTGKIMDALTGQAIQGATVANLSDHTQTVSDAGGNFRFAGGADSIGVTSIGYGAQVRKADGTRLLIFLTPAAGSLSEIVISANREMQKRTEVPVAIGVISQTQIRDTKATRLDMLVNQVPGVFMADLGNEQHSMSVRQPLGYGNLFLYLEDGIPIRTVGDFNHNALIEINQAALQRIEVIRGPASSLYGSEAVGGALNFITPVPSSSFSGKIQAEAGSRGYGRTDFSVSDTYKKTGIYLGGYYAGQHQGEDRHNDFHKAALTFKTVNAFNANTRLETVADYIAYKTDQKGGLDSADFYDKSYSSLYRFTYRKVDAFRLRSTLYKKWGASASTRFTVFYRNTSVGQNPFYSIADATDNSSRATGQINVDAFTSFGSIVQHSEDFKSLHIKWITGLSADLSPATYRARMIGIDRDTAGVYYAYQDEGKVLTDYRVGLLNTAAYTQAEYHPLAGLRFVLAARYDRLDYHFDNHLPPGAYSGAADTRNHFDHFSPKLGLTYNFRNNRGLYFNYSVGFAPPDITDLYTGVQVPVLKPSSYRNYEVGGWFAFAQEKAYVEASLYSMDGRNEIVSVRLPDGRYENQNAGATSHEGIELNIRYHPVKDLHFRIGGTVARHRYVDYIQQGKDFSGNDMAESPGFIANGEITCKPRSLKGLRLSLECQSLGSYFTDPQNTSRYTGFTVFNARAGYASGHFEAWVNCLNLANRNYAVTVEKSDYGTSYRPGQLRALSIGVAYHFDKKQTP